MSLFGSKKTVDQQLRANKRAISRAVRELDTEKRRLEQDKTRITGEIKKLAKQNEMDAVRILAKQIVRNNNYIKRFTLMRTNLEVTHHACFLMYSGRGVKTSNVEVDERHG